jgi:transposase
VIDPETVNQIRQLYYAEHWPVGTIARDLGLHRDTVARALHDAPRAKPGPRPSRFDQYLEYAREVLTKHPRLTSTRLGAMLRERGLVMSARQVRERVADLRPPRRETFLRRRTFAGEEAQADWASFGHIQIGRARRALSAFLLTLTYSRQFFVRFSLDQSMENFLRGHVFAFEDLRGVPRCCLYDNLKSAVLARYGEAVRFNPRLLELASHYHFAPRACQPARGNEKGAVERTVRYVRDSFFAARSFATVEDLNRQVLSWRDDVASKRRWPADDSKTVAEAYDEEVQRLLPLPVHAFETDLVIPVKSGKTIYVRFDLNDYSIPPRCVRRPLTLIASESEVRILEGTSEVARHRRSYDRHRQIEDATHLDELLEEKRRARGSAPRSRLTDAVPQAEAFLAAGFERGESVVTTTEKLLLLLEDHGAEALSAAVVEAIAQGTPRLGSVAFLLAKRQRAAQRRADLPVDLSHRPDLMDLYVKPHPSETYDALSQHNDDDRE